MVNQSKAPANARTGPRGGNTQSNNNSGRGRAGRGGRGGFGGVGVRPAPGFSGSRAQQGNWAGRGQTRASGVPDSRCYQGRGEVVHKAAEEGTAAFSFSAELQKIRDFTLPRDPIALERLVEEHAAQVEAALQAHVAEAEAAIQAMAIHAEAARGASRVDEGLSQDRIEYGDDKLSSEAKPEGGASKEN